MPLNGQCTLLTVLYREAEQTIAYKSLCTSRKQMGWGDGAGFLQDSVVSSWSAALADGHQGLAWNLHPSLTSCVAEAILFPSPCQFPHLQVPGEATGHTW